MEVAEGVGRFPTYLEGTADRICWCGARGREALRMMPLFWPEHSQRLECISGISEMTPLGGRGRGLRCH